VVDWSEPAAGDQAAEDAAEVRQYMYREDTPGWLGCGYGPFRRLGGGAPDTERILQGERRSARFVTLFHEGAALTNAEGWLVDLYNTARDGDTGRGRVLELVTAALATRLLPDPVRLEVNARHARLSVGGANPVRFEDLSDGYRSMLALGIDLLRWLIAAFPNADDPMKCPGVVLIDELDAHAHPTWQRQIGGWLRQKFPAIQFIVATHSPFLAQAADELEGNVVLEDRGPDGVWPRSDMTAVATWRIGQVLTELFDLSTTYKPAVEEQLRRHQDLHRRRHEQGLADDEEREYQDLTSWRQEMMPVAIEDPEDRRMAQSLREAVGRHAAALGDLT